MSRAHGEKTLAVPSTQFATPQLLIKFIHFLLIIHSSYPIFVKCFFVLLLWIHLDTQV